ncbi:MAG TPA: sigma-70 family RNA polymerase sigma factor [Thermoanaerobaculia bacterium]
MQIITADETELVARLQAGEDDAFEDLTKEHSPSLLRTARRFLRSEEDARDAVQDAFISLFKSIGGFESNSQLATWLHRILINCCLMRLRRQRRHPEEDIERFLPRFSDDGRQIEQSVPWTESAEAILQRAELRDIVRSSIDNLPERYRVVLLLRDIEEISTGEVAKLLDVTPNAVKVRLHRARQALRTLLDPHMKL